MTIPTSDLFPMSKYKDEVEILRTAFDKLSMENRSLRINLSLEKDKSEALRQELFNAESKIEELEKALKSLVNESRAVLGLLADHEPIGITNENCFLNRINEAQKALSSEKAVKGAA